MSIEDLSLMEQLSLINCLNNPDHQYGSGQSKIYMETLNSLGLVIYEGSFKYSLTEDGKEIAQALNIQEVTEEIPEEDEDDPYDALGIDCSCY